MSTPTAGRTWEKNACSLEQVTLSQHFRARFLDGARYETINAARTEAAELLGRPVATGTAECKLVDEAIEQGVAIAARTIAMGSLGAEPSKDPMQVYDQLVDLYQRQPRLSSRSSGSIQLQQYSTPPPIAYLMQLAAGINKQDRVCDITAGNGALLLATHPTNFVYANEIDSDRVGFLRRFFPGDGVTAKSITEENVFFPYGMLKRIENHPLFDAVLANPPYSKIKEDGVSEITIVEDEDEFTTEYADQAIALRTLAMMKDAGTGVLLLPGHQGDDAGRAKVYGSLKNARFWKFLYNHFNVELHISLDSKLYDRQGANMPVDLVVVRGRGKTKRSLRPALTVPRLYKSFAELEPLVARYGQITPILRWAKEADPLIDQLSVPTATANAFYAWAYSQFDWSDDPELNDISAYDIGCYSADGLLGESDDQDRVILRPKRDIEPWNGVMQFRFSGVRSLKEVDALRRAGVTRLLMDPKDYESVRNKIHIGFARANSEEIDRLRYEWFRSCNIWFDSGAYREFKKQRELTVNDWERSLPYYALNGGHDGFVVVPDVIGNHEKTWENWQEAFRRYNYLPLMPVWQWGGSDRDLTAMLAVAPVVGIGGCINWMREENEAELDKLVELCERYPGRFHIFACRWAKAMTALATLAYSADSSTWISAARKKERYSAVNHESMLVPIIERQRDRGGRDTADRRMLRAVDNAQVLNQTFNHDYGQPAHVAYKGMDWVKVHGMNFDHLGGTSSWWLKGTNYFVSTTGDLFFIAYYSGLKLPGEETGVQAVTTAGEFNQLSEAMEKAFDLWVHGKTWHVAQIKQSIAHDLYAASVVAECDQNDLTESVEIDHTQPVDKASEWLANFPTAGLPTAEYKAVPVIGVQAIALLKQLDLEIVIGESHTVSELQLLEARDKIGLEALQALEKAGLAIAPADAEVAAEAEAVEAVEAVVVEEPEERPPEWPSTCVSMSDRYLILIDECNQINAWRKGDNPRWVTWAILSDEEWSLVWIKRNLLDTDIDHGGRFDMELPVTLDNCHKTGAFAVTWVYLQSLISATDLALGDAELKMTGLPWADWHKIANWLGYEPVEAWTVERAEKLLHQVVWVDKVLSEAKAAAILESLKAKQQCVIGDRTTQQGRAEKYAARLIYDHGLESQLAKPEEYRASISNPEGKQIEIYRQANYLDIEIDPGALHPDRIRFDLDFEDGVVKLRLAMTEQGGIGSQESIIRNGSDVARGWAGRAMGKIIKRGFGKKGRLTAWGELATENTVEELASSTVLTEGAGEPTVVAFSRHEFSLVETPYWRIVGITRGQNDETNRDITLELQSPNWRSTVYQVKIVMTPEPGDRRSFKSEGLIRTPEVETDRTVVFGCRNDFFDALHRGVTWLLDKANHEMEVRALLSNITQRLQGDCTLEDPDWADDLRRDLFYYHSDTLSPLEAGDDPIEHGPQALGGFDWQLLTYNKAVELLKSGTGRGIYTKLGVNSAIVQALAGQLERCQKSKQGHLRHVVSNHEIAIQADNWQYTLIRSWSVEADEVSDPEPPAAIAPAREDEADLVPIEEFESGGMTWQETLELKNQLHDEFRELSDQILAEKVHRARANILSEEESAQVRRDQQKHRGKKAEVGRSILQYFSGNLWREFVAEISTNPRSPLEGVRRTISIEGRETPALLWKSGRNNSPTATIVSPIDDTKLVDIRVFTKTDGSYRQIKYEDRPNDAEIRARLQEAPAAIAAVPPEAPQEIIEEGPIEIDLARNGQISYDALRTLGDCDIRGEKLTLPNTYEVFGDRDYGRKVYEECQKVIERLGGRWVTGMKAHIFPGGVPQDELIHVLQTGDLPRKLNELSYYCTDQREVDQTLDAAEALMDAPPRRILEPSAGKGSFLRALQERYPEAQIDAYELDKERSKFLREHFPRVQVHGETDFLKTVQVAKYDLIVMNPPFRGTTWAKHLAHAIPMLAEGGVIAIIAPASIEYRDDSGIKDIRQWMKAHGKLTQLRDGAFKHVGVDIKTCLAVGRNTPQTGSGIQSNDIYSLLAQPTLTYSEYDELKEVASELLAVTSDEAETSIDPDSTLMDVSLPVPYEPISRNPDIVGGLIPATLIGATKKMRDRTAAEVGDMDEFVRQRLGYESTKELWGCLAAEQIDTVGMAILQLEADKPFTIGHSTGFGKGRIMAALIRYCLREASTPIFVTKKRTLYADLLRDCEDIHLSEFSPLVTNTSINLELQNGERLKQGGQAHADVIAHVAQTGELDRYDGIFTTGSQMQTVEQTEPVRREMLRKLAPNAVLLVDESHVLGGTPKSDFFKKKDEDEKDPVKNRAEFGRELLGLAKSYICASATYAKDPYALTLYAVKSDMKAALGEEDSIEGLIQSGGVPLMSALSTQMVESREYFRLQRSMEGVEVETVKNPCDHRIFDLVALAMRGIMDFDKAFDADREAIKQEIKADAGYVFRDSAIGEVAIETTHFTSLAHNFMKQFVLALSAPAIVEQCRDVVDRDMKPFITLFNTMNEFLKQTAANEKLNEGDVFKANFADLLLRYLNRSRVIIAKSDVEDPNCEVEHLYVPDAWLSEAALDAFADAKKTIEEVREDLKDVPISPIDFIIQELAKAGISCGEGTGRKFTLDYSGDAPVLRYRRTKKDYEVEEVARFNSGEYDAIIGGETISTGISAHSSPKFKDTRRRVGVVAQIPNSILIFMQQLGRIHRHGQLEPPMLKLNFLDIAGQKRDAAVIAMKLAMLNANTRGTRNNDVDMGLSDFINEVGDKVVNELLKSDQNLAARLNCPTTSVHDQDGSLITRATGRAMLLPVAEQDEFYQVLETNYEEALAELKSQGRNPLDTQNYNLEAEVLDSFELQPGEPGAITPFRGPVVIEKLLGWPTVFPPSRIDAINRVRKALRLRTARRSESHNFAAVETLAIARSKRLMAYLEDQIQDYLDASIEVLKKERGDLFDEQLIQQRREQMEVNSRQGWLKIAQVILKLPIGTPIELWMRTKEGDMELERRGIIVDVRFKNTVPTVNPARPSDCDLFILPDDSHSALHYSLSKFDPDNGQYEIRRIGGRIADVYYDLFNDGKVEKVIHKVLTGNILKAMAEHQRMDDQLVNFTMADGEVRTGILVSSLARTQRNLELKPVTVPSIEKAIQLLNDGCGLFLKNRLLAASKQGHEYVFRCRTKEDRAQALYINDPDLLDLAETQFYSSGDHMDLKITGLDKLKRILRYLGANQQQFEVIREDDLAIARAALGIKVPDLSGFMTEAESTELQTERSEKRFQTR